MIEYSPRELLAMAVLCTTVINGCNTVKQNAPLKVLNIITYIYMTEHEAFIRKQLSVSILIYLYKPWGPYTLLPLKGFYITKVRVGR